MKVVLALLAATLLAGCVYDGPYRGSYYGGGYYSNRGYGYGYYGRQPYYGGYSGYRSRNYDYDRDRYYGRY
jgi:hypothetical protein